jgi:transcriptional regulator with XRE-family HTH domain
MLEMDNFLKEFGQTLKTTRKQMGLSQVTAAQNMKIDYRHYQNIEGGKINLRLDTLMKLVKFYNLTKGSEPFNLDSFLDLLVGGHETTTHHHNWNYLYEHFVKEGHAGFISFRCGDRTVVDINDKVISTLGVPSRSDLVGRPIEVLLNEQSLRKIEELCQNSTMDAVTSPFIVTFKTQPPAYPVPLMALARITTTVNGKSCQCLFFDRRTLDEEGHRLVDIVSGYKQFMELYPQLKAV